MLRSSLATAHAPRAVFALALLCGTVLRLDQIGGQILGDDEWHSLAFLRWNGYAAIATTFGATDHSIPMTLWHRLLYDTIGLSEAALRAVPLAAGIVTLAAVPALLARWIGAWGAAWLAMLLALHPFHVYMSRLVRPYGIALLLSWIAIGAFTRWQRGDRRWGAAYAIATALTAWFHPVFAPFVTTPLAFEAIRRWRAREPLRPVVALGAAVAIGAAALLGPPLWADFGSLANKAGRSWPDATTIAIGAGLMAGTGSRIGVVAWWGAAALGAVLLGRRCKPLARLVLACAAVQIAAVLAAAPDMLFEGIVLARYLLPVAAASTLAMAVALSRAHPWIAGALVAVWIATGPLPRIHRHPNDWMDHGVYRYFYDARLDYMERDLTPPKIPAFYRDLAQQPPGSVTIAVAPVHHEWHRSNAFAYQRVHRQHVVVGDVSGVVPHDAPSFAPGDRQVRLRNMLPVQQLRRLRKRGVRYVVLHHDVSREIPGWYGGAATDVSPIARELEARCGAPVARDDVLTAFDLEACRRPRSAQP